MGIVDFILNLTGLLLWLSWCVGRADPLARAQARTLLGTLKPAEPTAPRRWTRLVWLGLLLAGRAVFYWQVGSALNWTPLLELGAVVLPFRSGLFGHAVLYSVLSFVRMFAVVYVWLLFLGVVSRPEAGLDPVAKLVRLCLGRVGGWPCTVQLLLPLVVCAGLWIGFGPLLVHLGIMQPEGSSGRFLVHAVLIGVGSYLPLRYLVAILLFGYLVNSYVYVGDLQLLRFVNSTAARVLGPLRKLPLRLGKFDFAPLVGIMLVLLAGEAVLYWLARLYAL